MECQELVQLRKQATRIKTQMDEQRRKARTKASHPRDGRPSDKNEYIPFLQCRLIRMAERIERHISQHCCQE
jgi:hypothetical protein